MKKRLALTMVTVVAIIVLSGREVIPASSSALVSDSRQRPPAPGTWGDSWGGDWVFYGESFHWPVLGQNQDGSLQVFTAVYTDPFTSQSTIYRASQNAPNGSWSDWYTLGNNTAYVAPTVGQNSDGRLEVFAQNLWYGFGSPPCSGPHYEVSHIWQTAPNGSWSDWAEMSQPSCSIDLDGPYVGTNQDGRMDVFAKGSDHNAWHRWQTAPSGGWVASWASIGKPAGLTDVSPIMSIGRMQDGTLVVFVLGSDYEIYQDWQSTVGDENNWSGWVGFGQPTGVNLSEPVVSQNADGRLQFFTAGADGAIWSKWQVAPNTYWSDWGSLGQPIGVSLSTPVVGQHPNGALDIFAQGSDYAIWHKVQTTPGGAWGSWESLAKPGFANVSDQLAVGRNQNGSLILFLVTTDGALWWKQEQLWPVYLPLIQR